jgi:four helix bundle protein
MDQKQMKHRTQSLALRVIRMIESMPKTKTSRVLGDQFLGSATSIGANYRACCRAKSTRDFINKLKIVGEEADETLFWLELIEKAEIFKSEKLVPLNNETNEILSIVVASIKTARKRTTPPNPKS